MALKDLEVTQFITKKEIKEKKSNENAYTLIYLLKFVSCITFCVGPSFNNMNSVHMWRFFR